MADVALPMHIALLHGVNVGGKNKLAMKDLAALFEAADPKRSPPDEFVVRGREIYLRLPNGVARSKLTAAYFDAKLATTTTQRNWRTVQSLVDLAGRER